MNILSSVSNFFSLPRKSESDRFSSKVLAQFENAEVQIEAAEWRMHKRQIDRLDVLSNQLTHNPVRIKYRRNTAIDDLIVPKPEPTDYICGTIRSWTHSNTTGDYLLDIESDGERIPFLLSWVVSIESLPNEQDENLTTDSNVSKYSFQQVLDILRYKDGPIELREDGEKWKVVQDLVSVGILKFEASAYTHPPRYNGNPDPNVDWHLTVSKFTNNSYRFKLMLCLINDIPVVQVNAVTSDYSNFTYTEMMFKFTLVQIPAIFDTAIENYLNSLIDATVKLEVEERKATKSFEPCGCDYT